MASPLEPTADSPLLDPVSGLLARGNGVRLDGRRPLMLDGSDGAWLVTAGEVDVFVVPLDSSGGHGRRRHIGSTVAGDLQVGADPVDIGGRRWHLEAVGLHARVVRLEPSWVDALSQDRNLERGLHRWLTETGIALDVAGPRLDVDAALAAGEPVVLERGHAIADTNALAWFRCEDAALAIGGVRPDAPQMVPLGAHWCVEAVAGGRGFVESSAQLDVGARRAGLHAYQEALITAHARQAEAESNAARVIAIDRRRVDADVRAVALSRFQELDADPAWRTAPGADPVLAACQVLGQRSGMEIVAPPEWTASQQEDPVRAIARASGVRVRAVTLGHRWWRSAVEPIVAFRESDGSPVALVADRSGVYRMVDPATGIEERVGADQAGQLRPSGFAFYRPLPHGPVTVWSLIRFGLRGSRADLVRMGVLSLAVGMLSLAFPVATGLILGTVVPAGRPGQVIAASVVLLLLVAASTGFLLTRSAAILRVQGRMLTSMQGALWDRLVSLPVQFFLRYSPADLTQRVNGVDSIQQIVAAIASQTGLALVTLVFSSVLLFFFNVPLALLVLAITLLTVCVSSAVTWMQISRLLAMYNARGRASGALLQVVQGIDKVRAAAAENRALRAWAERFALQASSLLSAARLSAVRTAIYATLPAVLTFTVFAVVASHPDMMTNTAFLSFITALGQIAGATILLDLSLGLALNIVPLFDRMRPVLTEEEEVRQGAADPGPLSGSVELAAVTYRYPGMGVPVLRDVNMRIEPGDFVALVGPSGSGKSTVVRLLLGFDVPESGSVTYDDKDLSSLDLRAVRAQIGVCLQDASVTGSDILAAIVGDRPLSEDDAWSAAERVGLADEIRALPMGMRTVLGSDAATFSGGQRQRLVLAAALARNPRIVILDEATSTLDAITQAKVAGSFRDLHVTRLVVAHRLSTIRHADRIVVLDQGQVVQQGTFDELRVQPGIFAEMVRRQSL